MKKCINCGTEKKEDFCKRSGGYCRECHRRYNKEKNIFLKIKSIKYLGERCSKCGYSETLAALEFHHVDNKTKDNEISYLAHKGARWEEIKNELDKCVLLCSNCHKKEHHGVGLDYSFEFDMDALFSGKRRKRIGGVNGSPIICKSCKKEFYAHISRKYCSYGCYYKSIRKAKNRPSREEIEKMIIGGKSMESIGREFGVSGNAVKKWVKKG